MFGTKKEKWNENLVYNYPIPKIKEFKTIDFLVDDIYKYHQNQDFEIRNKSIDSLICHLEKIKELKFVTHTETIQEYEDRFKKMEKEIKQEYFVDHIIDDERLYTFIRAKVEKEIANSKI